MIEALRSLQQIVDVLKKISEAVKLAAALASAAVIP
jgi:hypothetical protein